MTSKFLPLLAALLAPLAAPADSLSDFAASIEHDLDGRCIGYGYSIYQNGQYVRGGGGGWRQMGDPNNQFNAGLPFDENTVKDCHSMSKTITAAAMLKALGDSGVSLDSSILPFLPLAFQEAIQPTQAVAMQTITFRHLLNHRSGFGGSQNYSWEQVLGQVMGGLKNSVGEYEYCNLGYALCRILIPYVLDEDYYRDYESEHSLLSQMMFLPTMCATHYIDFVNAEVFAPAGLPIIHPRPVNSTIGNFALYHDFLAPYPTATLMPDRTLTVGSGGWALSAKQYGRFVSGLFNGQIVSGTQLGWMRNGDLGMQRENALGGGEQYNLHNGAANIGDVGGRSLWMHFPAHNIQVAVQLNSRQNAYSGYGMGLNSLVHDGYERAFTTPPSSQYWARHLFVRRSGDGWTGSRGIDSNGKLGDRNYDGELPAGFEFARFFAVGGQGFVLHYKPVNGGGQGRAVMQKVNPDGTLGTTVFDSPNWLGGWTHVETFSSWQGTFLLLHNHNTGRIRTIPVSELGTLGAAITDHVYSTGYEVAEIIDFGIGDPHLFRHDLQTGHTHLRRLNDDGSVGATQYDNQWNTGFTDFSFYRSGDTNYLLRYNPANGAARINSFGNTLNGNQQVLNQVWSQGWAKIRFFEIGGQTYNFRYNPENGNARIQEIRNDGTFGELVWESTKWLQARGAFGPFMPAVTGWTEVEFYDATPGMQAPNTVAQNPTLPVPATLPAIDPIPIEYAILQLPPEFLNPAQILFRRERGDQRVDFEAPLGQLVLLEESHNMKDWRVVEAIVGDDEPHSMPLPRADGSAPPSRSFYRVRSMPAPDQAQSIGR